MSNNSRPGKGTITGYIWEICDAITEKTGAVATLKQLFERGSREDLNPHTMEKQYYRWRTFSDLSH